ncbi:hypothetical protein V8C86DRAFT_2649305 [Haematococcus lacustris]
MYGSHMVLLALQKPGQRSAFAVSRPNTGHTFFDLDRDELLTRYSAVSPDEVQAQWEAVYHSSLTRCIHASGCGLGDACMVGRRLTPVTLLSGSVVRVWGALEGVLARHEATLSKADRTMRVVRVELTSSDPSPHKPPGRPPPPAATPAQPKPGPLPPAAPSPSRQLSEGGGSGSPSSSSSLEIVGSSSPCPNKSTGSADSRPHPPPTAGAAWEPTQHGSAAAAAAAGGTGQAPDPPPPEAPSTPGVLQVSSPAAAPPAQAATEQLVGVRYPAHLLLEVVATLRSAAQQAQQAADTQPTGAGKSGKAGSALALPGVRRATLPPAAAAAAAALSVVEPATPVDPKSKARAFRPPKTLRHFFAGQPACQVPGGVLAAGVGNVSSPRPMSQAGLAVCQGGRGGSPTQAEPAAKKVKGLGMSAFCSVQKEQGVEGSPGKTLLTGPGPQANSAKRAGAAGKQAVTGRGVAASLGATASRAKAGGKAAAAAAPASSDGASLGSLTAAWARGAQRNAAAASLARQTPPPAKPRLPACTDACVDVSAAIDVIELCDSDTSSPATTVPRPMGAPAAATSGRQAQASRTRSSSACGRKRSSRSAAWSSEEDSAEEAELREQLGMQSTSCSGEEESTSESEDEAEGLSGNEAEVEALEVEATL